MRIESIAKVIERERERDRKSEKRREVEREKEVIRLLIGATER